MTTFEEMDHNLGLHKSPVATCWICRGDEPPKPLFVAENILVSDKPPAFPDWGTIWVDTSGALHVFVKDGPVPESGATSRWVTVPKNWVPKIEAGAITPPLYEDTQTEWGSGKWAEGVQQLAVDKMLPGEAAISSPMGVSLPEWASEQNRAVLTNEMFKARLFPICTSMRVVEDIAVTNMTKVSESVNVVRLPPY